MNREALIEELLEKPYWVIDILPKQVPIDSDGQYVAIEQYYLQKSQITQIRQKYLAMKKLKRMAAALLAAGMLVSSWACGAGASVVTASPEEAAAEEMTAEEAAAEEVTAEEAAAKGTSAPAETGSLIAGTVSPGAETAGALTETAATSKAALVPSQEDSLEVEEILGKMSLRDKVEQMMFVSFRTWEEAPGKNAAPVRGASEDAESSALNGNVTRLSDELRAVFCSHRFGGTVLFAENYRDAEQTLRLIRDIQQSNQEGGGIPLLVATDQEGGSVARIGFGTTGVGNMALAATGDPDNARQMAAVYGRELRLLGVNTDLAPVLDINDDPSNPVIGVRSFSDTPETVSEFGLAFLDGLHEAGTIATLKHFPGHGSTDTDSHTGFPCIQSSYEELKSFELVPFQAAIDAGADMVMTAHIQYPQIERETYTSISTGKEVTLPATMSKRILTDILREDMGFAGVIVTDALDMAAISDNFAAEDILTLSINAGANMLLLPTVTNRQQYEKTEKMIDLAVRLAEEGTIEAARIDDSVRRILSLKGRYGLLGQKDFSLSREQAQAAADGVGSSASRHAAMEIAGKALTLVKNDNGAFPLKVKAGEEILLLFADSCANRAATGDLAERLLREEDALPKDAAITVLVNTADNEKACAKAASRADHVILVYRTYGAGCLDPGTEDGFSSAVFDRIIERRHADGHQAVLVSCQLPYDAARFAEADAVLLTYNSAIMEQIPPETGEGSAYAPNLLAGLLACFGEGTAYGSLPVDIPALDEDFRYTDRILFRRQLRAQ